MCFGLVASSAGISQRRGSSTMDHHHDRTREQTTNKALPGYHVVFNGLHRALAFPCSPECHQLTCCKSTRQLDPRLLQSRATLPAQRGSTGKRIETHTPWLKTRTEDGHVRSNEKNNRKGAVLGPRPPIPYRTAPKSLESL